MFEVVNDLFNLKFGGYPNSNWHFGVSYNTNLLLFFNIWNNTHVICHEKGFVNVNAFTYDKITKKGRGEKDEYCVHLSLDQNGWLFFFDILFGPLN